MSDLAKEKAARLLKKRGSLSSLGSHEVRAKEAFAKTKDTVSYMEEPGHHDDIPRPAVQMENTYQLSESLLLHCYRETDLKKNHQHHFTGKIISCGLCITFVSPHCICQYIAM
uniref:Uncharacterized protein n=1 Tax=Cyprinus carpio TaxID=7962 RepID=A0A8C1NNE0_CYPCA